MALTKIPRGLLDTGIADSSDATAITIDSSENATFAGHIRFADDKKTIFGAGDDLHIYHSGGHNYIDVSTSDQDLIFKGTDGGSDITALTLDMSAAGAATFNSGVTLSGDLSISYNGGNITWGTNYPAIGNIKSSQATLLGNNIKAGSANNTIVRHAHGSDAGNFIALTYNKGVTFHTGITTTQNSDAAETTNERMRINTSGYVGIGETSPDNKLHITGADWNNAHIRIERTDNGSANDPGIVFKSAAGANDAYGLGSMWFQNALDSNAYAMIRARTDDSSGWERVLRAGGANPPFSGFLGIHGTEDLSTK